MQKLPDLRLTQSDGASPALRGPCVTGRDRAARLMSLMGLQDDLPDAAHQRAGPRCTGSGTICSETWRSSGRTHVWNAAQQLHPGASEGIQALALRGHGLGEPVRPHLAICPTHLVARYRTGDRARGRSGPDMALRRSSTPTRAASSPASAFTGRLQARGIGNSMDGSGRCMDNIFIERLWQARSNTRRSTCTRSPTATPPCA